MSNILTRSLILGVVFSVAAIGAVVLLSSQVQAAENNSNRVDVFVSFDKTPGASERAIVERAGGTVRHSYTLVPAIAASVPESVIQGLQNSPHVTSVELDGTVYAVDVELDNAWGVKRVGSGTVHDGGNKGTGVKIGIIDSGVDYNHQDLNAVYAGGHDFVNNDTDPNDVYGHGTHVAGTACAEDNNSGVVGVTSECALYSLRVLNDSGSGSWSATIAAMEWAVANGLQVVNLSLGSSQDPGSTVKAAFDNAEAEGLVIVAAGGNSGNPPGNGNNVIYPAKYASVIAVAATDKNDTRPSWSSTGEEIELAAPGVSVLSTWNDADSPHNPQPIFFDGDWYKEGSGTSMASPHVAGVAALVIAAGITDANGNGRINDEVRAVLTSTADDIGAAGKDTHYGYGLVNAAVAVGAIAPPATGTISGTVTDADTLDPIAGATVSDGTRQATTDANGDYSITDVPEGTYTVTASQEGYVNASQTNVVVTENTTTTVNFALTAIAYGAIEGIITDADSGNPIEGAIVTDGTRQATTDTTGYYLVTDVPEGGYTVIASAAGYQDATQIVAVTGGSTIAADFVLQPVTEATTVTVDSITYTTEGGKNGDKHLNIHVSIVDDLGNSVANASVSIEIYLNALLKATGTGTTGSNGIVTFSYKNAPSGHYETKVTAVTVSGLSWDGSTPANGFDK